MSYYGASFVAGIFKGLAIVWVTAGILGAFILSAHHGLDYEAAAVGAGLVLGAWCAFFGYVISLLRDIATNSEFLQKTIAKG